MGDPPEKLPLAVVGVVPCYNAGGRVAPVAAQALEVLEKLIVVDDGCTDGCLDAVRALPLRVLSFERNRGKGHALIAGIRAALESPETEAVCVFDADGQHDPAEIPRFYRTFVEEEADFVIGARVFDRRGGVPWRSRFGNTVTVACTAWLVGRRLPDTQCGFRMLSRRFAQDVVASVAGGRYETEMEVVVKAIREGYRVATLPIQTIYEEGNRSSHFRKIGDSMRIYARLFRSVLRAKRRL
jgi:glycosyltransferase involved in cell wall biosynthesis